MISWEISKIKLVGGKQLTVDSEEMHPYLEDVNPKDLSLKVLLHCTGKAQQAKKKKCLPCGNGMKFWKKKKTKKTEDAKYEFLTDYCPYQSEEHIWQKHLLGGDNISYKFRTRVKHGTVTLRVSILAKRSDLSEDMDLSQLDSSLSGRDKNEPVMVACFEGIYKSDVTQAMLVLKEVPVDDEIANPNQRNPLMKQGSILDGMPRLLNMSRQSSEEVPSPRSGDGDGKGDGVKLDDVKVRDGGDAISSSRATAAQETVAKERSASAIRKSLKNAQSALKSLRQSFSEDTLNDLYSGRSGRMGPGSLKVNEGRSPGRLGRASAVGKKTSRKSEHSDVTYSFEKRNSMAAQQRQSIAPKHRRSIMSGIKETRIVSVSEGGKLIEKELPVDDEHEDGDGDSGEEWSSEASDEVEGEQHSMQKMELLVWVVQTSSRPFALENCRPQEHFSTTSQLFVRSDWKFSQQVFTNQWPTVKDELSTTEGHDLISMMEREFKMDCVAIYNTIYPNLNFDKYKALMGTKPLGGAEKAGLADTILGQKAKKYDKHGQEIVATGISTKTKNLMKLKKPQGIKLLKIKAPQGIPFVNANTKSDGEVSNIRNFRTTVNSVVQKLSIKETVGFWKRRSSVGVEWTKTGVASIMGTSDELKSEKGPQLKVNFSECCASICAVFKKKKSRKEKQPAIEDEEEGAMEAALAGLTTDAATVNIPSSGSAGTNIENATAVGNTAGKAQENAKATDNTKAETEVDKPAPKTVPKAEAHSRRKSTVGMANTDSTGKSTAEKSASDAANATPKTAGTRRKSFVQIMATSILKRADSGRIMTSNSKATGKKKAMIIVSDSESGSKSSSDSESGSKSSDDLDRTQSEDRQQAGFKAKAKIGPADGPDGGASKKGASPDGRSESKKSQKSNGTSNGGSSDVSSNDLVSEIVNDDRFARVRGSIFAPQPIANPGGGRPEDENDDEEDKWEMTEEGSMVLKKGRDSRRDSLLSSSSKSVGGVPEELEDSVIDASIFGLAGATASTSSNTPQVTPLDGRPGVPGLSMSKVGKKASGTGSTTAKSDGLPKVNMNRRRTLDKIWVNNQANQQNINKRRSFFAQAMLQEIVEGKVSDEKDEEKEEKTEVAKPKELSRAERTAALRKSVTGLPQWRKSVTAADPDHSKSVSEREADPDEEKDQVSLFPSDPKPKGSAKAKAKYKRARKRIKTLTANDFSMNKVMEKAEGKEVAPKKEAKFKRRANRAKTLTSRDFTINRMMAGEKISDDEDDEKPGAGLVKGTAAADPEQQESKRRKKLAAVSGKSIMSIAKLAQTLYGNEFKAAMEDEKVEMLKRAEQRVVPHSLDRRVEQFNILRNNLCVFELPEPKTRVAANSLEYTQNVMFLKRLILLAAYAGVWSCDANKNVQRWSFPLASLFCHGNRVLFRLENIYAPQVMYYLLTGILLTDPEKMQSLQIIGKETILKKRLAATHGVELNPKKGDLVEVKLKATNITQTAQNIGDGLSGHHYGLDLPFCGLGSPLPVGPPSGTPERIELDKRVLESKAGLRTSVGLNMRQSVKAAAANKLMALGVDTNGAHGTWNRTGGGPIGGQVGEEKKKKKKKLLGRIKGLGKKAGKKIGKLGKKCLRNKKEKKSEEEKMLKEVRKKNKKGDRKARATQPMEDLELKIMTLILSDDHGRGTTKAIVRLKAQLAVLLKRQELLRSEIQETMIEIQSKKKGTKAEMKKHRKSLRIARKTAKFTLNKTKRLSKKLSKRYGKSRASKSFAALTSTQNMNSTFAVEEKQKSLLKRIFSRKKKNKKDSSVVMSDLHTAISGGGLAAVSCTESSGGDMGSVGLLNSNASGRASVAEGRDSVLSDRNSQFGALAMDFDLGVLEVALEAAHDMFGENIDLFGSGRSMDMNKVFGSEVKDLTYYQKIWTKTENRINWVTSLLERVQSMQKFVGPKGDGQIEMEQRDIHESNITVGQIQHAQESDYNYEATAVQCGHMYCRLDDFGECEDIIIKSENDEKSKTKNKAKLKVLEKKVPAESMLADHVHKSATSFQKQNMDYRLLLKRVIPQEAISGKELEEIFPRVHDHIFGGGIMSATTFTFTSNVAPILSDGTDATPILQISQGMLTNNILATAGGRRRVYVVSMMAKMSASQGDEKSADLVIAKSPSLMFGTKPRGIHHLREATPWRVLDKLKKMKKHNPRGGEEEDIEGTCPKGISGAKNSGGGTSAVKRRDTTDSFLKDLEELDVESDDQDDLNITAKKSNSILLGRGIQPKRNGSTTTITSLKNSDAAPAELVRKRQHTQLVEIAAQKKVKSSKSKFAKLFGKKEKKDGDTNESEGRKSIADPEAVGKKSKSFLGEEGDKKSKDGKPPATQMLNIRGDFGKMVLPEKRKIRYVRLTSEPPQAFGRGLRFLSDLHYFQRCCYDPSGAQPTDKSTPDGHDRGQSIRKSRTSKMLFVGDLVDPQRPLAAAPPGMLEAKPGLQMMLAQDEILECPPSLAALRFVLDSFLKVEHKSILRHNTGGDIPTNISPTSDGIGNLIDEKYYSSAYSTRSVGFTAGAVAKKNDALLLLFRDLQNGKCSLVRSRKNDQLFLRRDTCRVWICSNYERSMWYVTPQVAREGNHVGLLDLLGDETLCSGINITDPYYGMHAGSNAPSKQSSENGVFEGSSVPSVNASLAGSENDVKDSLTDLLKGFDGQRKHSSSRREKTFPSFSSTRDGNHGSAAESAPSRASTSTDENVKLRGGDTQKRAKRSAKLDTQPNERLHCGIKSTLNMLAYPSKYSRKERNQGCDEMLNSVLCYKVRGGSLTKISVEKLIIQRFTKYFFQAIQLEVKELYDDVMLQLGLTCERLLALVQEEWVNADADAKEGTRIGELQVHSRVRTSLQEERQERQEFYATDPSGVVRDTAGKGETSTSKPPNFLSVPGSSKDGNVETGSFRSILNVGTRSRHKGGAGSAGRSGHREEKPRHCRRQDPDYNGRYVSSSFVIHACIQMLVRRLKVIYVRALEDTMAGHFCEYDVVHKRKIASRYPGLQYEERHILGVYEMPFPQKKNVFVRNPLRDVVGNFTRSVKGLLTEYHEYIVERLQERNIIRNGTFVSNLDQIYARIPGILQRFNLSCCPMLHWLDQRLPHVDNEMAVYKVFMRKYVCRLRGYMKTILTQRNANSQSEDPLRIEIQDDPFHSGGRDGFPGAGYNARQHSHPRSNTKGSRDSRSDSDSRIGGKAPSGEDKQGLLALVKIPINEVMARKSKTTAKDAMNKVADVANLQVQKTGSKTKNRMLPGKDERNTHAAGLLPSGHDTHVAGRITTISLAPPEEENIRRPQSKSAYEPPKTTSWRPRSVLDQFVEDVSLDTDKRGLPLRFRRKKNQSLATARLLALKMGLSGGVPDYCEGFCSDAAEEQDVAKEENRKKYDDEGDTISDDASDLSDRSEDSDGVFSEGTSYYVDSSDENTEELVKEVAKCYKSDPLALMSDQNRLAESLTDNIILGKAKEQENEGAEAERKKQRAERTNQTDDRYATRSEEESVGTKHSDGDGEKEPSSLAGKLLASFNLSIGGDKKKKEEKSKKNSAGSETDAAGATVAALGSSTESTLGETIAPSLAVSAEYEPSSSPRRGSNGVVKSETRRKSDDAGRRSGSNDRAFGKQSSLSSEHIYAVARKVVEAHQSERRDSRLDKVREKEARKILQSDSSRSQRKQRAVKRVQRQQTRESVDSEQYRARRHSFNPASARASGFSVGTGLSLGSDSGSAGAMVAAADFPKATPAKGGIRKRADSMFLTSSGSLNDRGDGGQTAADIKGIDGRNNLLGVASKAFAALRRKSSGSIDIAAALPIISQAVGGGRMSTSSISSGNLKSSFQEYKRTHENQNSSISRTFSPAFHGERQSKLDKAVPSIYYFAWKRHNQMWDADTVAELQDTHGPAENKNLKGQSVHSLAATGSMAQYCVYRESTVWLAETVLRDHKVSSRFEWERILSSDEDEEDPPFHADYGKKARTRRIFRKVSESIRAFRYNKCDIIMPPSLQTFSMYLNFLFDPVTLFEDNKASMQSLIRPHDLYVSPKGNLAAGYFKAENNKDKDSGEDYKHQALHKHPGRDTSMSKDRQSKIVLNMEEPKEETATRVTTIDPNINVHAAEGGPTSVLKTTQSISMRPSHALFNNRLGKSLVVGGNDREAGRSDSKDRDTKTVTMVPSKEPAGTKLPIPEAGGAAGGQSSRLGSPGSNNEEENLEDSAPDETSRRAMIAPKRRSSALRFSISGARRKSLGLAAGLVGANQPKPPEDNESSNSSFASPIRPSRRMPSQKIPGGNLFGGKPAQIAAPVLLPEAARHARLRSRWQAYCADSIVRMGPPTQRMVEIYDCLRRGVLRFYVTEVRTDRRTRKVLARDDESESDSDEDEWVELKEKDSLRAPALDTTKGALFGLGQGMGIKRGGADYELGSVLKTTLKSPPSGGVVGLGGSYDVYGPGGASGRGGKDETKTHSPAAGGGGIRRSQNTAATVAGVYLPDADGGEAQGKEKVGKGKSQNKKKTGLRAFFNLPKAKAANRQSTISWAADHVENRASVAFPGNSGKGLEPSRVGSGHADRESSDEEQTSSRGSGKAQLRKSRSGTVFTNQDVDENPVPQPSRISLGVSARNPLGMSAGGNLQVPQGHEESKNKEEQSLSESKQGNRSVGKIKSLSKMTRRFIPFAIKKDKRKDNKYKPDLSTTDHDPDDTDTMGQDAVGNGVLLNANTSTELSKASRKRDFVSISQRLTKMGANHVSHNPNLKAVGSNLGGGGTMHATVTGKNQRVEVLETHVQYSIEDETAPDSDEMPSHGDDHTGESHSRQTGGEGAPGGGGAAPLGRPMITGQPTFSLERGNSGTDKKMGGYRPLKNFFHERAKERENDPMRGLTSSAVPAQVAGPVGGMRVDRTKSAKSAKKKIRIMRQPILCELVLLVKIRHGTRILNLKEEQRLMSTVVNAKETWEEAGARLIFESFGITNVTKYLFLVSPIPILTHESEILLDMNDTGSIKVPLRTEQYCLTYDVVEENFRLGLPLFGKGVRNDVSNSGAATAENYDGGDVMGGIGATMAVGKQIGATIAVGNTLSVRRQARNEAEAMVALGRGDLPGARSEMLTSAGSDGTAEADGFIGATMPVGSSMTVGARGGMTMAIGDRVTGTVAPEKAAPEKSGGSARKEDHKADVYTMDSVPFTSVRAFYDPNYFRRMWNTILRTHARAETNWVLSDPIASRAFCNGKDQRCASAGYWKNDNAIVPFGQSVEFGTSGKESLQVSIASNISARSLVGDTVDSLTKFGSSRAASKFAQETSRFSSEGPNSSRDMLRLTTENLFPPVLGATVSSKPTRIAARPDASHLLTTDQMIMETILEEHNSMSLSSRMRLDGPFLDYMVSVCKGEGVEDARLITELLDLPDTRSLGSADMSSTHQRDSKPGGHFRISAADRGLPINANFIKAEKEQQASAARGSSAGPATVAVSDLQEDTLYDVLCPHSQDFFRQPVLCKRKLEAHADIWDKLTESNQFHTFIAHYRLVEPWMDFTPVLLLSQKTVVGDLWKYSASSLLNSKEVGQVSARPAGHASISNAAKTAQAAVASGTITAFGGSTPQTPFSAAASSTTMGQAAASSTMGQALLLSLQKMPSSARDYESSAKDVGHQAVQDASFLLSQSMAETFENSQFPGDSTADVFNESEYCWRNVVQLMRESVDQAHCVEDNVYMVQNVIGAYWEPEYDDVSRYLACGGREEFLAAHKQGRTGGPSIAVSSVAGKQQSPTISNSLADATTAAGGPGTASGTVAAAAAATGSLGMISNITTSESIEDVTSGRTPRRNSRDKNEARGEGQDVGLDNPQPEGGSKIRVKHQGGELVTIRSEVQRRHRKIAVSIGLIPVTGTREALQLYEKEHGSGISVYPASVMLGCNLNSGRQMSSYNPTTRSHFSGEAPDLAGFSLAEILVMDTALQQTEMAQAKKNEDLDFLGMSSARANACVTKTLCKSNNEDTQTVPKGNAVKKQVTMNDKDDYGGDEFFNKAAPKIHKISSNLNESNVKTVTTVEDAKAMTDEAKALFGGSARNVKAMTSGKSNATHANHLANSMSHMQSTASEVSTETALISGQSLSSLHVTHGPILIATGGHVKKQREALRLLEQQFSQYTKTLLSDAKKLEDESNQMALAMLGAMGGVEMVAAPAPAEKPSTVDRNTRTAVYLYDNSFSRNASTRGNNLYASNDVITPLNCFIRAEAQEVAGGIGSMVTKQGTMEPRTIVTEMFESLNTAVRGMKYDGISRRHVALQNSLSSLFMSRVMGEASEGMTERTAKKYITSLLNEMKAVDSDRHASELMNSAYSTSAHDENHNFGTTASDIYSILSTSGVSQDILAQVRMLYSDKQNTGHSSRSDSIGGIKMRPGARAIVVDRPPADPLVFASLLQKYLDPQHPGFATRNSAFYFEIPAKDLTGDKLFPDTKAIPASIPYEPCIDGAVSLPCVHKLCLWTSLACTPKMSHEMRMDKESKHFQCRIPTALEVQDFYASATTGISILRSYDSASPDSTAALLSNSKLTGAIADISKPTNPKEAGSRGAGSQQTVSNFRGSYPGVDSPAWRSGAVSAASAVPASAQIQRKNFAPISALQSFSFVAYSTNPTTAHGVSPRLFHRHSIVDGGIGSISVAARRARGSSAGLGGQGSMQGMIAQSSVGKSPLASMSLSVMASSRLGVEATTSQAPEASTASIASRFRGAITASRFGSIASRKPSGSLGMSLGNNIRSVTTGSALNGGKELKDDPNARQQMVLIQRSAIDYAKILDYVEKDLALLDFATSETAIKKSWKRKVERIDPSLNEIIEYEWVDEEHAVEKGVHGVVRSGVHARPKRNPTPRISSILVGVEGCGPGKKSPFLGIGHDTSGKSNFLSARGSRKWRAFSTNYRAIEGTTELVMPMDLGGMRGILTKSQFAKFVEICDIILDPRTEDTYWWDVFNLMAKGRAHLKNIPKSRDLIAIQSHRKRLFKEILCGDSTIARALVDEAFAQKFETAKRIQAKKIDMEEEKHERRKSK